jgi:hypothetical protein
MDSCCSTATTFSSLTSFYTIYTSTKFCSTPLSSSNSSKSTRSIDVALGLIYSFAHQCCLLLPKNSTKNVPIVSMSWIIVYINYISPYMPSLLQIPKMMMNVATTLQPTTKYSTHLLFVFFSTPLLVLFFSTIPLPPHVFICIHSYVLPFPLLFFIVFQWLYLHSCCCELQNFENMYNFQQQTQFTFDGYFFFCPWTFHLSHSFFYLPTIF